MQRSLSLSCLSSVPLDVCRMLYTELLQLWDEAVQAVDVRDWSGALAKLEQITEPTSRTLFNAASAHLALRHLDPALKVSGPTCWVEVLCVAFPPEWTVEVLSCCLLCGPSRLWT